MRMYVNMSHQNICGRSLGAMWNSSKTIRPTGPPYSSSVRRNVPNRRLDGRKLESDMVRVRYTSEAAPIQIKLLQLLIHKRRPRKRKALLIG